MNRDATQTAIGPMVIVAAEQYEPAPLIRDPWARYLLPAGARLAAAAARWSVARHSLMAATDKKFPGGWASFLCRKRYIDDCLHEGLRSGIESVVILGAGYDTRAYRIPELTEMAVCEVDLPANIAAKTAAVRRTFGDVPPHVTLLPMDFEADEMSTRLSDAGFDQSRPVFYIWEAVTQYLTEAAVRTTMDYLSGAASGSALAFTYVRKDFLDGRETYGAPIAYREFVTKDLWKFGWAPQEVAPFLAEYGWTERDHVGEVEYRQRYLVPAGRTLAASPIERAVYARR